MAVAKPDKLVGRIVRDKDGAIAVLAALVITVVIACAGIAVDYTMLIAERERIRHAADAGTLATARALTAGEINTGQAEDYFKRIFSANVGKAEFDETDYDLIAFDIDPVRDTVSATVSLDQPLFLLGAVLERNSALVAQSSQANYGVGNVEVVFVLDVTGSMEERGKIVNLKSAAANAVTTLLDGTTKVRVALVPYSQSIDAGPLAHTVFPDGTRIYSDGRRPGKDEFDSRVPEPKVDAPVYNHTTDPPYDRAAYGGDDFGHLPDSCATDRKAPKSSHLTSYQFTDDSPDFGMISRDGRLDQYINYGGKRCPSQPIVLLTSDLERLLNAIEGLRGKSQTAGHIGMQWGRYVISPKWAPFMPADAAPGDMSADRTLRKYIIFMTDGENNKAFADNYNPHGFDSGDVSDTILDKHCTNAKAQNVVIYSIAYDIRIKRYRVPVENCASSPSHYFHSRSVGSIDQTFKDIVDSIKKVSLTQ